MKIDGGCHCGAITYEADVDPDSVIVCHCTDCQTLSGSAYRTVAPVTEGTFRLLSGEPRTYVKIADSGRRRAQVFCSDCGTPIYAGPVDGETGMLGIRVGTARQRDRLVPKAQAFTGSAQGWVQDLSGLGRFS